MIAMIKMNSGITGAGRCATAGSSTERGNAARCGRGGCLCGLGSGGAGGLGAGGLGAGARWTTGCGAGVVCRGLGDRCGGRRFGLRDGVGRGVGAGAVALGAGHGAGDGGGTQGHGEMIVLATAAYASRSRSQPSLTATVMPAPKPAATGSTCTGTSTTSEEPPTSPGYSQFSTSPTCSQPAGTAVRATQGDKMTCSSMRVAGALPGFRTAT